MSRFLVLVTVLSLVIPMTAVWGSESSPYVVGEWFLQDSFQDGTTPVSIADTQFTFLNPTTQDLVLEYAFFDTQGGFCGCDRDTLHPNGVTRYTMSAEAKGGMFACTGSPALPVQTTGTMKAIVFQSAGPGITLEDARRAQFQQVGFQMHFFTNGHVTETGLKGITITADTSAEIQQIHQQCVTFCTQTGLCPPFP